MAAPSEKELGLIEKFRKMVAEFGLNEERTSDMFLLGWLRARDLDLNKAKEMLRASLEWRKTHEIDTILDWVPPQSYLRDYHWSVVGNDKEGSPVGLIPFGVWDVRRVIESGEKGIWLKYTDLLFGKIFKIMRDNTETGNWSHPITQFIVIFDFKGFTMRQLASFGSVDSILEVIRRFEANYPESLKAAIVVNAPYIFSILFSLVKPLLSARTLSKVTVYGSNEAKWKHALLKLIDEDQLPVYYGGRSTSGQMNSVDDFITETEAGNNRKNGCTGNEEEELVSVHIGAGQKLELEYDIVHPNTILRWSFKTDHYDVGFSIVYNDKAEVVPYKRYQANATRQEGSLNCEKPGKYMLIFDNTYSKLRHKALHYMATTSTVEDFEENQHLLETDTEKLGRRLNLK